MTDNQSFLEQIEIKLRDISIFYMNREYLKNDRIHSISLMSGISGILVLLLSFFKTNGYKKKYAREIESTISYLIEIINEEEVLINTYCNGLAGMGQLFLIIKETEPDLFNSLNDSLDIDSFLTELDESIIESLESLLKEQDYDLMHGAMGIGLYFIKRGKHKIVETIIRGLDSSKITEHNEIKWHRFDRHKSKEYLYDFGLAHGNASILYFLGKCYINNICPQKCLFLVKWNINFFINNIQSQNNVNSYFPTVIPVKSYKYKNNIPFNSRLAWCYGDLGILHTLLLVSKWTSQLNNIPFFTDMLLKISKKNKDEDSFLVDSQFCHGMSGIALIFQSAYQITKNTEFKEVVDYWIMQIIKDGQREDNDNICGYKFKMGENVGWLNMVDLLSGLGGVGLALSSYKYNLHSETKEIFFLN